MTSVEGIGLVMWGLFASCPYVAKGIVKSYAFEDIHTIAILAIQEDIELRGCNDMWISRKMKAKIEQPCHNAPPGYNHPHVVANKDVIGSP